MYHKPRTPARDIAMEALYAKARRKGLWFYNGRWFSPGELELERSRGRCLLRPDKWVLRDPLEYLSELGLAMKVACDAYNTVNERIRNEQRKREIERS